LSGHDRLTPPSAFTAQRTAFTERIAKIKSPKSRQANREKRIINGVIFTQRKAGEAYA
jgi:hypothetical protein